MAFGPPEGAGGGTCPPVVLPSWHLTVLAAAAFLSGGCAVELRLAEVEDPGQATSTITYTGVRDQARRFPDYGAIDATILDVSAGQDP